MGSSTHRNGKCYPTLTEALPRTALTASIGMRLVVGEAVRARLGALANLEVSKSWKYPTINP